MQETEEEAAGPKPAPDLKEDEESVLPLKEGMSLAQKLEEEELEEDM